MTTLPRLRLARSRRAYVFALAQVWLTLAGIIGEISVHWLLGLVAIWIAWFMGAFSYRLRFLGSGEMTRKAEALAWYVATLISLGLLGALFVEVNFIFIFRWTTFLLFYVPLLAGTFLFPASLMRYKTWRAAQRW